MKKILYILLLALLPLLATAQEIRYDTIRVSPDDSRNIHRGEQQGITRAQAERQPAQNAGKNTQNSAFDKSKLRFGANLGLSLSRNYTVLGLGPQVGYQFSDYFMAGAGAKYYYTKIRTTSYEIKNNMLGANLFGYVYPVRFITVFAQPELNYIWSDLRYKSTGEHEKNNRLIPSVIVGAGFRMGRSHITMNYDLVQDVNSPYPEGFYLGFSTFF